MNEGIHAHYTQYLKALLILLPRIQGLLILDFVLLQLVADYLKLLVELLIFRLCKNKVSLMRCCTRDAFPQQ